MADNVDRVFVMANPKGRSETATGVFVPLSQGQVALIEEHPFHPWDENAGVNRVFIVQGDPPCEAYLSEGVQEKLLQNQLVQVSAADAKEIYKNKTGRAYPGAAERPSDTPVQQQMTEAQAAAVVLEDQMAQSADADKSTKTEAKK